MWLEAVNPPKTGCSLRARNNPERYERDQLERLWFYYGNYGPKTTPGNHSFIQRLLENGIDERPLYTKRTPKSEIPTPECEAAVDDVLRKESTGI